MLTLGYITKLNNPGDNLFEVRVPLLEKAGSPDNPNLSGSYFQATLCQMPGQYEAYSVGDCVTIGFLDGRMDKPIILGKLLLGGDREGRGFLKSNSLQVTEKAELPEDTTIGALGYSDLLSMVKATDFLSEWSKYLNTGYIEANSPASLPVTPLWSIRIGNAKFIVPSAPQPIQYYQHSLQLILPDNIIMEFSLVSSSPDELKQPKYFKDYTNISGVKGDPKISMEVVHISSFEEQNDKYYVNYYMAGGVSRLYSSEIVDVYKDIVTPI